VRSWADRWKPLRTSFWTCGPGQSGDRGCPAALAHDVVLPARAAPDEVLALGVQALMQLAGEQGNSVDGLGGGISDRALPAA